MIEPTEEMVVAWRDAMKAAAAEAVKAGEPLGRSQEVARAGLAAVLAIVERDRPRPATILMNAAATARGIADRLAAKPGDGKVWPAMSAGARLVAVRLVELADDADGNGYVP